MRRSSGLNFAVDAPSHAESATAEGFFEEWHFSKMRFGWMRIGREEAGWRAMMLFAPSNYPAYFLVGGATVIAVRPCHAPSRHAYIHRPALLLIDTQPKVRRSVPDRSRIVRRRKDRQVMHVDVERSNRPRHWQLHPGESLSVDAA